MYAFAIFFLSNKYLIEYLRNLTLVGFFGEMGVYSKNLIMQFCCALLHLLCKISTSFFNTHLGGDFGWLKGVIKRLFNSVLSAHRLRVYAKFGVCRSYGIGETLSAHDRQTDRRLIKNIYTLYCLVCLLRSATYLRPELILFSLYTLLREGILVLSIRL